LKLVEKSVSVLGEEDPVSSRLAAAMEAYTGARDQSSTSSKSGRNRGVLRTASGTLQNP